MSEIKHLIVYIRAKDEKYYRELKEENGGSCFLNEDWPIIFMAAVAEGFEEGSKFKIDDKKNLTRWEYFDEDAKNLLYAIAAATTGDATIAKDENAVFDIAEEYAAGGIKKLYDGVIQGSKRYLDSLEREILDKIESIYDKSTSG